MGSSGNFSTMNPLHRTSTNVQYSNGNLTFSPNSSWSTTTFTRNNIVIPKDKKIYMEVHCDNQSGDYHMFGVSAILALPEAAQSGSTGTVMIYNGSTRINGTRTDNVVTNPSQGDIVGIAIDGSNNKVWFAVNNTWQLSGDPSNGTNELGTVTTNSTVGTDITFAFNQNSASILTANFGQDSTFGGQKTAGGNADANGFGDFYYAPPTGFLALTTANLSISDDIDPAQTDDDYPSKQFGAYTYTGSNGSAVTVSTDFQPDLIWIKSRDSTDNHYLQDSTRGFGNSKSLSSNSTGVQGYNGGAPSSSGAQNVGSSSFQAYGSDWSRDTDDMIAWCWRANGGTTSSNSDGALTSTLQANTKAGFSISKYTSNGSGQTFGHGLGATPDWFIIKKIDNQARNWISWHKDVSTTTTGYFRFSTSNAEENDTIWNNTAPTSSVISVQKDTTEVNSPSGDSYICYAWRGIEGYSKFGKYEGNGNNGDGPFIYTGFRPRLLFIKDLDAGNEWYVQDTARETYNPTEKFLEWNTNDAEQSKKLDILSNGFKPREDSGRFNDTHTYIYGAWADVSFKYNNTF